MNIKNVLLDNWGIKLVSLGLSLALWFYVTSKGKSEMTITVPLELRNIPPETVVVGDVTGSLEVRLQSQERELRDISVGKKVVGVIDLSMAKIGENLVHVSPDDIRRPSGVAVTHISPAEIAVKLEPLARQTFRLRPVLHGAPASGFRISKIVITPQKITVEGPESAMKALDKLQTIPIDVQGAEESLTVEPKIDYQGQPLKILEKNISVGIQIERVHR